MDPNNQNPQPTTPGAPADNAALDAINKLDQETPAPMGAQPAMEQPTPVMAPATPEQPMPSAPSPMPAQDAQPTTPAAAPIGGAAKKSSSTTKILVIVLVVAFLALAGFFAWQFFTTGRLI